MRMRSKTRPISKPSASSVRVAAPGNSSRITALIARVSKNRIATDSMIQSYARY
jgi:hypothetical protein